MQLEPWAYSIAMLCGTLAAPAVCWPAERVRIVVGLSLPDADEDAALDAPAEPELRVDEIEVAIGRHLDEHGPATTREVAAALALPRNSVWRRLRGMRDRGAVELSADRSGRGCGNGAGWIVRAA